MRPLVYFKLKYTSVHQFDSSTDLPVVLAMVSSFKDRAIPQNWVAFGELGLSGDVRAVPSAISTFSSGSGASSFTLTGQTLTGCPGLPDRLWAPVNGQDQYVDAEVDNVTSTGTTSVNAAGLESIMAVLLLAKANDRDVKVHYYSDVNKFCRYELVDIL